ncbi:MAG: hypothetical protein WC593_04475 [Methanoregula sp.]
MVHKNIIILANSRRHDGHCIAGKDLSTGEWIRPINILGRGKPRLDQSAFSGEDFIALNVAKSGPQLLDCVRISFGDPCGDYCQPENISIDGKPWTPLPPFIPRKVFGLIDDFTTLFIGKDDQNSDHYSAEEIQASPLKSSLNFIRLTHSINKTEIVHTTSIKGNPQHRLKFEYDSRTYNLAITDKGYENTISQSKNEDGKIIDDCFITIGVGEGFPIGNAVYHYRLIVGIIPTITLR